jgi:hypothetical protein
LLRSIFSLNAILLKNISYGGVYIPSATSDSSQIRQVDRFLNLLQISANSLFSNRYSI